MEAARQDAAFRVEQRIARAYAQELTPDERRRAFLILFVSLVCMGAGQSVIYTILPPIARQLDIGPFQVTSIFAVSAASRALMRKTSPVRLWRADLRRPPCSASP